MTHDSLDQEAARAHRASLDALAAHANAQVREMGISTAPKAQCSKCQRLKPLSDFYADRSKPSGHHSRCIGCMLEAARLGRERRKAGKHLRARRSQPTQEEREQAAQHERAKTEMRVALSRERDASRKRRWEAERDATTEDTMRAADEKWQQQMREFHQRARRLLKGRGD